MSLLSKEEMCETMDGIAGANAPPATGPSSNGNNNKSESNNTAEDAAASAENLTLLSPRLLAQDAVNWYMAELDPYEDHATNIQTLFRPAVMALTCFLLQGNDDGRRFSSWVDYMPDRTMAEHVRVIQHMTSAAAACSSSSLSASNNNQKLPSPPSSEQTQSQTAASFTDDFLPKLDRRSVARMEAFLNGLVLAVPATRANNANTTTKKNKRGSSIQQQQQQQQSTKAAFVPGISLLDGLRGFSSGGCSKNVQSSVGSRTSSTSLMLLRSVSNGATSTSCGGSDSASLGSGGWGNPQIRSMDLMVRLELYLRTLTRVVKTGNSPNTWRYCVLSAEPPRAIKARVGAIVTAFCDNVCTVRQQGPVLTRLITYMTMELLAVSCLSDSCKGAIRRVVMDYEHQTSFASLAFLSSPEDAADQNLVPLLHCYFTTLKENWQTAVQDCELEDMLQRVLDPDMRRFFKTVEFTSIGHLLETCSCYGDLLSRIKLPPPSPELSVVSGPGAVTQNEDQVRQAIRDLQRERITINGSLLPPVKSRKELIRILSQTLNSATLTPFARGRSTRGRSRRRKHYKNGNEVRRSESAPDLDQMRSTSPRRNSAHDQEEEDADYVEDGSLSSLNEESELGLFVEGESTTAGSSQSCHPAALDISTVDRLTKRLLLAASRTGKAGDAYFIVRDLFGGKDVQVLPSQDLRGAGGFPSTTLELWLSLSCLTIRCHTSFDVYPLLPDHGNDPYSIVDCCEPLIQLHTTTTEVIALHEVRASDAAKMTGDNGTRPFTEGHFVLQERITPETGWRSLSIRPARYEKLQVWTTPS